MSQVINKMSRAELLQKAKDMYPHYTYLYRKRKAELEALVENQYCPLKNTFKDWKNNSCYIDSLLFVLARIPHLDWKQTQPTLSSIQKKIATKIRQQVLLDIENANVYLMRSLLQKFKGSLGDDFDWLRGQQEPMDLWRTLEEMFVMFRTKQIARNGIVLVANSAIHEVFLTDGCKLLLKSTEGIITAADMLVFHINRRASYSDSRKRTDRVEAPLRLRPRENKRALYLRAIIVHHGSSGESGHYTTVFDCKGVWWEFDDMKSNIKRVGLTLPDYVNRNSSDYFYW